MSEYPSYNPWSSLFRSEPELRSLYEWLDTEAPRGGNGREWGIWGGITGTAFGLAGGAIGVLAGGMRINPDAHPWVILVPMTAALLISVLSGAVIAARRNRSQVEAQRTLAEARTFTWSLISARWHGSVKNFLGEDRAQALNEGAEHVLRCHRALRSAAWKSVGEGTEHAAVRDRVGGAMNVAMARLVNLIGRGAVGQDPEVRSLIQDMKIAADEAVKTANRLEGSGAGGDGAHDLRQALSEMRLLNQAHDEVEGFQSQG